MTLPDHCDILVVGGGNAGFCAAIAAAEALSISQSQSQPCSTTPNNNNNNDKKNTRVLLIDKCPASWAGGNTYFTAGAFRTVHGGLADLLPLVNNVDDDQISQIDIDPYTAADFLHDLRRVTGGRCDPALSRALVHDSNETVQWLARHGVRFQLAFNRQAYEVDGRVKFWGGMALKTEDGGKGLIAAHRAAADRLGVVVSFSTAARGLVTDPTTGGVTSVLVVHDGQEKEMPTTAVILAAGGFEANPRLRAQYLGPDWDVAMVRGTPYNTGDVLETALRDCGALPAGHWSGCHAVAWDAHAPPHAGDRERTNELTKSGYPLGIMVNRDGERFVDEGADLRNYTYALVGRAILQQPGHVAFQVWDSRTAPWLRREEYREEVVPQRITASSIAELAEKCARHGLRDQHRFLSTIEEYNRAVYRHRREHPHARWNPAGKDGLSTQSSTQRLRIPKSHWALPLDAPPFLAVKVGCGITFTFGGLAVDPDTAAVLRSAGGAIPGLYCAGEMLGGLFYDNYPGGSGLMAGAVFGRRAGRAAAAAVMASSPAPARGEARL